MAVKYEKVGAGRRRGWVRLVGCGSGLVGIEAGSVAWRAPEGCTFVYWRRVGCTAEWGWGSWRRSTGWEASWFGILCDVAVEKVEAFFDGVGGADLGVVPDLVGGYAFGADSDSP